MPAQLPSNLVGVEDIEERYHLDRTTIWKKIRDGQLANIPGSGVYRVGSRNYRFNPHEFGKWLLSEDRPPEQPPVPDIQPEPSRRDALNVLRKELSLMQAAMTRMEEKVDTINRALLALVRNGRKPDATGKRTRGS